MKKLFLALCVCAGLCACSSDDDLISSSSVDTAEGSVAYLTVNLKDVNSSTRATEGGFAYGTGWEQFVRTANFYFYDEGGNYVAKGSISAGSNGVSGTANETEPAENIEWESNTLIAVYGLELDDTHSLPTKMLTILNQPSDFDPIHMTLAEATSALAGARDGYGGPNVNADFVMSTSVYQSGDTLKNYTALDETNFAKEPINLTADYGTNGEYKVVDVYVERLAAKVTANVGSLDNAEISNNDTLYNITDYVKDEFANGAPEGGVYVKLEGFAVNGVARDAYMSKQIDNTSWSGLTFNWNDADNHRSYWAKSPNYGLEVTYPTSSNGRTNSDEISVYENLWLNPYLRYVNLKASTARNPILKSFGDGAYCGENTNTTAVLQDASSNGITNLLVKGQVYTHPVSEEGVVDENTYEELDLVEYHGMYFTADDFLQKCVDDVVAYDFTVLVDSVITYLKNDDRYSSLGTYLDELNDAIYHDHIFKTLASAGTTSLGADDISAFGGEMLSLYNAYDGNVRIYYNMTTQPQWGNASTGYTNIDPTLAAKYPKSAIVYNADVDLDNYNFWFHVDYEKFQGNAGTLLGLAGILKKIGDEYYMPIDNSIYFTTGKGHTYTTRNYLLRAITEECDDIDTEFGSHYPNLFKDGLMYYHVPIEHLGTTTGDTLVEGQYGIVRNHYYNITITSLENFGRGIADEDEVIVPQPDITYYYLGANINILSWKHITQGVDW